MFLLQNIPSKFFNFTVKTFCFILPFYFEHISWNVYFISISLEISYGAFFLSTNNTYAYYNVLNSDKIIIGLDIS